MTSTPFKWNPYWICPTGHCLEELSLSSCFVLEDILKETGLTESDYSKLKIGFLPLTEDLAKKFAKLFNVTSTYLLKIEENYRTCLKNLNNWNPEIPMGFEEYSIEDLCCFEQMIEDQVSALQNAQYHDLYLELVRNTDTEKYSNAILIMMARALLWKGMYIYKKEMSSFIDKIRISELTPEEHISYLDFLEFYSFWKKMGEK